MIADSIFRNGNQSTQKVFWQSNTVPLMKDGHVLGGPFYYIENGMGVSSGDGLQRSSHSFGAGVGLIRNRYIYTGERYLHLQCRNFFDPNMAHTVALIRKCIIHGQL